MGFHEVQFPTDISYGATGGPGYATDIVQLSNGFEKRLAKWASARARYNVAHGIKTQAQLDALIAFFRGRQGRAYGFRYKDWTDYSVTGQQIAVGDDSTTLFQLVKAYSSGSQTTTRVISKPVSGSVAVYVDAALQESGLSVNYTDGTITFDSAPAAGEVISVDCEFDVPVRFDSEQLNATINHAGVFSWNDIPLVEVRV